MKSKLVNSLVALAALMPFNSHVSAQGFTGTASNWPLPGGGQYTGGHAYGFNNIAYPGGTGLNDQGWSLADMDGDGRTDLVVLGDADGTYFDCFGAGTTNQYWMVYFNNGSGFSSSASNWGLPAGGKYVSGHYYGFNTTSYSGSSALNNVGWTLMDINGDLKPDLVITSEGDGTYKDCYGAGSSNQYWKVFLNTGSGFSSASVNWPLPGGGAYTSGHSYGFNAISYTGSSSLNDQGWTIMDLNGDLKPDLVLTSEGDGTYRECFGAGTANQSWTVFYNNGSGFAGTGSNWSLPAGGKYVSSHYYGFSDASYAGSSSLNDQGWSTTDLDGDAKPDLIILCEGDGTYKDVVGGASSAHWLFYSNNGNGFSSSPANWPVPTGGQYTGGHYYGYNSMSYPGSSSLNNIAWTMMDMDGDARPDLVNLASGTGTYIDCYGAGTSNQTWEIFYNNGSGFPSTPSNWSLPGGGEYLSGHSSGFNSNFNLGSSALNNQGWATMDLTGDRNPDLVLFAEGDGTYRNCFGAGGNQYWMIFTNTLPPNGISQFNKAGGGIIEAYPNPATDRITLIVNSTQTENSYALFDYTGKRVMSGALYQGKTTLDLNGLRQGVYLLKTNGTNPASYRIVKEN